MTATSRATRTPSRATATRATATRARTTRARTTRTPTPTSLEEAKDPPKTQPQATRDVKPKKVLTAEQKASRTKANYHATMSSCDSLLACITTDVSWSWANNSEQLKGVKNAKDLVLAELGKSIFVQEFLTLKTSDAMKKYGDDFQSQCATLVHVMDPVLVALAREKDALVQMKLARDKSLVSFKK